jgi:hypothetical protein
MNVGHSWNERHGTAKLFREKHVPVPFCAHQKSHMDCPRSAHCLCTARSATNKLSYGMAYVNNTKGNYFSLDMHIQGYGICEFKLK